MSVTAGTSALRPYEEAQPYKRDSQHQARERQDVGHEPKSAATAMTRLAARRDATPRRVPGAGRGWLRQADLQPPAPHERRVSSQRRLNSRAMWLALR